MELLNSTYFTKKKKTTYVSSIHSIIYALKEVKGSSNFIKNKSFSGIPVFC